MTSAPSTTVAFRSLLTMGLGLLLARWSPPLHGQTNACRIAPPVVLQSDGSPTEFTGVIGAVIFPSGNLVVANRRPAELRFFDSRGSLVRRVGRTGEGPGEFRALMGLIAAFGDSVATFDVGLQRIMMFDHAGNLGRVIPLAELNPSGGLLMTALLGRTPAGWSVVTMERSRGEVGLHRSAIGAAVVQEGKGIIRSLGPWPGPTRFGFDDKRGGVVLGTPIFAANGLLAHGGSATLLYADGATSKVRLHALDRVAEGKEMDGPFRVAPLPEKAKSAAIDARLKGATSEQMARARPLQVQMLEGIPTVPSVDVALGDVDGFWLRGFVAPSATAETWARISPTGATICRGTFPVGWKMVASGMGRVVAVHESAEGIETVGVGHWSTTTGGR